MIDGGKDRANWILFSSDCRYIDNSPVWLFVCFFFFLTECQNYKVLNNADRKKTYKTRRYYNYGGVCDNGMSHLWYRFEDAAGNRMATSCVPEYMCNTVAPGWLSGGHPSVADGRVNRVVCFHAYKNCCYYSTTIPVRNCGSYYVYYLAGTFNTCRLRYCGSD